MPLNWWYVDLTEDGKDTSDLISALQGSFLFQGIAAMFKQLKNKLCYYMSRVPHHLPDIIFLRYSYWRRTGVHLNLCKPVTFNDKLQWLKLNYRDKRLIQLVDKYGVRDYVKERVGESALIPLHGVYNTAAEIKFEELPDQFVLKPTHGSGWLIICHDKTKLDWPDAQKKLAKWMTEDYAHLMKEWAYSYVPRKIVCEKLLQDKNGQVPMDYKFFCADGKPLYCQVNMDRFTGHTLDLFDMDWNHQQVCYSVSPNAKVKHPRPESLERMAEIAAKLSKGLPFCRIDLYDTGDHPLLGEITLYPSGGYARYNPAAFGVALGDKIKLPKPCNNLHQLKTARSKPAR